MSTFQINYNPAAATALNALHNTSEKLNNLQRQLSTGLRINGASDDPAGLMIKEDENLTPKFFRGYRCLLKSNSQIKNGAGWMSNLS